MSQSETGEQDNKNMDKKEIADEEREKMLNQENNKHAASQPAEEVEEHKPKRKIPIGAIKMPGFCRSKSKEPSKDDESKPVEIDMSAAAAKDAEVAAAGAEKSTPTKDSKEKEAGLLDTFRLRLTTAFQRRTKRGTKESDAELGNAGGVGLASVETLDDAEKEKKDGAAGEDVMETVRLDADAAHSDPPSKQPAFLIALSRVRRNPIVTGVITFLLFAVLVLFLIACYGPRRVIELPIIDGRFVETQTGCGIVQGVKEQDAYVFRGIPYAVPPTGENRWKTANDHLQLNEIHLCWPGKYLAHNESKHCWQRGSDGRISGHEDCLFLDVFTPQIVTNHPLPVVVMIGADTLTGPSPGIMRPDGSIARIRDMVFVRPNFRLGVFGFLATEAIASTIAEATAGNYGLSDIVAVLDWVQLNIKHFGGDSKNVVLWGHRAGATLVTALLGSKPAQGKFHRAWISSASSVYPGNGPENPEKIDEQFMGNIKCSDLSCLLKKSAEELMEAVPEAWNPKDLALPDTKENDLPLDKRHAWLVKDGVYVTEPIGDIFAKNKLAVNIIMGTTAQSGAPSNWTTESMTEAQVEKTVRESLIGLENFAEAAFTHYNKTVEGLATMISDLRVVCPLARMANSSPNLIPFYVSTFKQNSTALANADSDAAAILGLYPNTTPEQRRHLQAIQALFANFVWHGGIKLEDPAKKVLVVDQDVLPHKDYDNCNFWLKKFPDSPKWGKID